MIIDNLDDKRADWNAISDNVMGGISEVNFYQAEEGDEKFYRLEGSVSTANNGGFIQSVARFPFNAEDYTAPRFMCVYLATFPRLKRIRLSPWL